MNTLPVGADSAWLVQAGAATLLILHIAGGLVAIVSGGMALAFRKGRGRHALAGRVFFISMMFMTLIGAFVAPFLVTAQGNPKLFDSTAGFFTFYLVVTGWMTVRRKAGTIGRFEVAAFVFAVLLAAEIVLLGTRAAGGASSYYGLGAIIALAAALDLKVILKGGIAGVPRIARHLWRMSLALLVATGSFFLGQQRVMPEAVRGSPILLVLGLAPLAFMLFWLVRVRFGKRLRAAFAALGERPAPVLPGVASPDRKLATDAGRISGPASRQGDHDMTSTTAPTQPGLSELGDGEVARWRLHVLRAIALFFVVSGLLSYPQMLFNAEPTDRGMIKAFLVGLWLMSFLAVRYPLKMLPIFLFECAWKAVWLLVFGLPQWISGIGSPRLSQDLLEIGVPPIVLAIIIPWTYVWRHYVRQKSEPWR